MKASLEFTFISMPNNVIDKKGEVSCSSPGVGYDVGACDVGAMLIFGIFVGKTVGERVGASLVGCIVVPLERDGCNDCDVFEKEVGTTVVAVGVQLTGGSSELSGTGDDDNIAGMGDVVGKDG
jgi:hypothetical protein